MPNTDRNLSPSILEREMKRSPRTLALVVVFIAVMMLGATAGLMDQTVNIGETNPSEPPLRVLAGVVYTAHSQIFINGNAGFTNASGVVWGSGTASDPYIIADWDIDVASNQGIWIQNTNAHFIVRNCYVHGSSSGVGISLSDCVNGALLNNTCWNCSEGISLVGGSNNTLINNTCNSNSGYGAYILSSSNNTISGNNLSNNIDGIYFGLSSNNTLVNNICGSNAYAGIYVIYANSTNTLMNNTCDLNSQYGIYLYSSSKTTIFGNHVCNNTNYGVFSYNGSNVSSFNRFWNNTFIGNNGAGSVYDASHVQAYDDGTNNWWNSTDGYGNWWSDWTTPDANHDGIVDQPYAIDGSAGVQDNYPLTMVQTQIHEFGMLPFVVMALMAVIVLAGETRRKKP